MKFKFSPKKWHLLLRFASPLTRRKEQNRAWVDARNSRGRLHCFRACFHQLLHLLVTHNALERLKSKSIRDAFPCRRHASISSAWRNRYGRTHTQPRRSEHLGTAPLLSEQVPPVVDSIKYSIDVVHAAPPLLFSEPFEATSGNMNRRPTISDAATCFPSA